MTPNLEVNLEALAISAPGLVKRICAPVNNQHVIERAPKELYYVLRGSEQPLLIPPLLLAVPTLRPNENAVLIVGVGAGEQLRQCLNQLPKKITLTAWERDPWMLRVALDRNDFSEDIHTGRLSIRLGVDILEELKPHENRKVVFHPLLRNYYPDHTHLVESPRSNKTVLLRSGGLFVTDLAESFRERGYDVYPWDTDILDVDEIRLTLEIVKPTLIASINYAEGLCELAEQTQTPFICWEIDPATTPPSPLSCSADFTSIFTYRKNNIEEFQSSGFQTPTFLPLGTNPNRRSPIQLTATQLDHYRAPVSFVGTSMAEQASLYRREFVLLATQNNHDNAAKKLETMLSIAREDFTTFNLPQLLEQFFPGLKEATTEEVNIDAIIGEITGAEKRFAYVAGLSEFSIQVWGDSSWRAAEHFGARYRGPAGHFEELTKIYCCSTVNIDIGRIYQSEIITMRVFDVLACGGFILTEETPDLATHFQIGRELETYRDLDELRRKTHHFLQHPDEAREIGSRGRERVLKDHTISKRVELMLNSLETP